MRVLEFVDGQSRLARAQVMLMRSFHFRRYPKFLVEPYVPLCSSLNSEPCSIKDLPFFVPILPLVNTIQ